MSATNAEKHTPGPWTVETQPSDSGGTYITGHVTSPLHTYAGNRARFTRPESITSPDTMTKADAHLIAAAPEMYEALKHAIGILENMDVDALGESGTSEDSWLLRDEYLHHFRAAIAKAEGRS